MRALMNLKVLSEPSTETKLDARSKIITAATMCFEQNGPAKTSMEDIAAAARVDRKTIYRAFSNRTALLDTILMQRLGIMVEKVKPFVDATSSLDEAVINGTYESMRTVTGDHVVMQIVEESNDRGVVQFMADQNSPITLLLLRIWQDAFARARAINDLRKDLTDQELVGWLLGVHVLLLLRNEFSAEGQQDFLKKFFLPSLRHSV